MNRRGMALYVHIPFCRRRCTYCHFTTRPHQTAAVEDYLDLLARELTLRADPADILDTLYLGGGSPSLLTPKQLGRLMLAIRKCFPRRRLFEATIEVNPEDLSLDWLRSVRDLGFNRISIGLQSLDPRDLDFLGRVHTPASGLEAIHLAAAAGFSRINADLILGLPDQTPRSVAARVRRLVALPLTHLSIYLLEITPDDTDSQEARSGELFSRAARAALNAGFQRYEVSSFARPGGECRHNLTYWRNKDYIGIGLSAAGYLQGRDYRNTTRMDRYVRGILAGRPVERRRRVNPEQRQLVTGLRLVEGVPAEALASRLAGLEPLLKTGVLVRRRGRVAVAPERMLLLNEILARYIL